MHLRPSPFDTALAVAAAIVLIVPAISSADTHSALAGVAVAVATAAPLAWRRRWPIPVLLVVMTGAIACVVVSDAANSAVLVALVPLYTVAVLGDRRRSLAVAVGTTLLLVATTAVLDGDPEIATGFARLLVLLGALVLGEAVRTRGELRAETAARVARELQAQSDEQRRQLADERVRIARDLHDTLAHALVAINVRAGVAAHLGGGEESTAALTDIKAVSAEALRDLRATLGLLRQPGDAAPTAPMPDLDGVPRLVERLRAAGIAGDAHIEIDHAAVPSPVGNAAFRIVQESLTNVLRHAHAETVRVDVRVADQHLLIDVVDDGRGGDPGDGHGLRGMTERAAALGGQLVSGPASDGGWRVAARLPLDARSVARS